VRIDLRKRPQGLELPLPYLSMDAFVSDLSRLTVLDHEVRHFHDTLLYPFGATILQQQITLTINGLSLIGLATTDSKNANVLPIPLHEWLLMPAVDRARFVEQQKGQGRQVIVPELPIIDPDDEIGDLPRGIINLKSDRDMIVAASRIAVSAYKALQELWSGPQVPGDLKAATTVAVWEVAGTLCQMAAIHRRAGGTNMQRFADWFLEHGPRRYRLGLQMMKGVSSSPPGTTLLREFLALTAWAQMGRFRENDWESSPLFRLYNLQKARREGLRWSVDEPFLDLVSIWDEAIGRSSVDDLHDSTRELASLVDRSVARAHESQDDLPLSWAAAGLQAYYKAHLVMKQAFLRDPDTFVDPMTYAEHRSFYPEPAVMASLEQGFEDEESTRVIQAVV